MARRKAPKGCFWRGSVLWGRIQTGGTDIKWSLRTDDPATALRRREAERKRAVAAQRYGDHRRTFAEALEGWSGFIVDQISPKTIDRYTTSLNVLQPHLDGLYLDEIDKELIGRIVAHRRDVPAVLPTRKRATTASIATIKRDLTALSSVLDYAVDEGWASANPVLAWLKPDRRRKSRLQERRDPIILPDPGHIQMVIDRAGGLFRSMIVVALKTGARLDELTSAQRSHLDLERRQLTLVGKRNKVRVVDLDDDGEDFGLAELSALPTSAETRALFWHQQKAATGRQRPVATQYKQASTNFRRLVAAVAAQAQKQEQHFRPFRFHDLRHAHAVNWLKSGRSIYTLQQRLGHTSVKTTEVYLSYLTPEEKQRVMFARVTAGTKSGTSAPVLNSENDKISLRNSNNLE